MRTRFKFIKDALGFSLKNIKRLEVQFDPFHPNAYNVREFYAGATIKKSLKASPECITLVKVVSDRSDPLVTVHFEDNHKLAINAKYLESSHLIKIVKEFQKIHNNDQQEF